MASAPIPVIDTHIHLFDSTRPQGVPWPPRDDTILYRPALPPRYRQVTAGLGIVGAVVVECSPWVEDNQWVLDEAAHDSIVVGIVGNLDPGEADFPTRLEGLHQNPLFRGIRYGNLWGRSLSDKISDPKFVSNLKLLSDAGLSLDTANPDPALIAAVVRLSDEVPSLRVVIDHLPQLEPPQDSSSRSALQANLQELGKRPQVYFKLSEVLHTVSGRVHPDLDFYRSRLDELWGMFGPDRIMYGSDWPNSDHSAPFRDELEIVRKYLAGKGTVAAEGVFWKSSVAAYRWVKRAANQPSLHTSSASSEKE